MKRRAGRSWGGPGPATFGSWRTRWSARRCWRGASILAGGDTLRGDDVQVTTALPAAAASAAPASGAGTMEEIEQAAIKRALSEAGGNRRRAAGRLRAAQRTSA